MSRLYDALTGKRNQATLLGRTTASFGGSLSQLNENEKRVAEFTHGDSVMPNASPESRLVALTGRGTLGADQFRALANRLTHLRKKGQLRSLQVTSSGLGEGKTVVASNLALTLALYARCRTLLVEGDLHRPAVATSLGLRRLPGLTDWWPGRGDHLASYIRRIHGSSLWVLTAGTGGAQPSEILASPRLKQAIADLSENFEWVVVDSPPMSPGVDVNLWSRIVDGTVLVVREGVTQLKCLRKSLATLDDPKLIGVVLNEASDLNGVSCDGRQFFVSSRAAS